MALGYNLDKIQVALIVLCQQDKVIITLFLLPVVPLRDIDLTANYWLDGRVLLGILEELFYAVHVAVVRYGQGRHTKLLGPVKEVFYGRLPVQDGVLGMDMEVNETHATKIRNLPQSSQ